MLVGELKGLDQAQGLLDGPSDREVVDGDLPQDALVINDEQPSEMTGNEWFISLHRCSSVLSVTTKKTENKTCRA